MKKFTVLFLFALCVQAFGQQNSLLWKASKPGKQDIYLYGTIHIQDKSVFNLSDSTVSALQRSSLVLAEVDLENMMYEILSGLFTKDTSNLLSKKMSPSDFEKLRSEVEGSTGMDIRNIDADKSWMIDLLRTRNRWKTDESKTKETFLDAYIIRMGQLYGKKTGGIETMKDYSDIVDEYEKSGKSILNKSDESDFDESSQEYILNLYLAENIRDLYDITDKSGGEYFRYFLKRRNENIALRLDSIASSERIFQAVGAAHLAGESGLIELLKKNGYTLKPVKCISANTIKSINLEKQNYSWKTFSPENKLYSIEFPKKEVVIPYSQSGIVGEIYLAPDIFSNTHFMCMELKVPYIITKDKSKTLLEAMEKSYSSRFGFVTISSEIIDGKEFPMLKLLSKNRSQHFNMKLYLLSDRIVMMSVYGTKKNATSVDAEKFLNSFSYINFQYQSNSSNLSLYRDTIGSMSLLMPANIKAAGPIESNSMNYFIRNGTLQEGNFYYMIYDFGMEINPDFEKEIINGTIKNLLSKGGTQKKVERDTILFNHYPSYFGEFYHKESKNSVFMVMFFRDSRLYQFYAESKDIEKARSKFDEILSSITLLPYFNLPNQTYTTSDSLQFVKRGEADSTNYYDYSYGSTIPTLKFRDMQTGLTWVVKTYKTSEYLSPNDKEKYFNTMFASSRDHDEYEDTLYTTPIEHDAYGFKKMYFAKAKVKVEFDEKSEEEDTLGIEQTMLYQTTGALYFISIKYSSENKNSPYIKGMFEKTKKIGTVKKSKSFEELISNLKSADTTISYKAYDDMYGASMKENDLRKLEQYLSIEYPLDTQKPYQYVNSVKESIISILLESKPNGYEVELKKQYTNCAPPLRKEILKATMSGSRSDSTIKDLFIQLIAKGLPLQISNDSTFLRNLEFSYYGLKDSVLLKTLLKQINHTDYQQWIIMSLNAIYDDSLVSALIEENEIALINLVKSIPETQLFKSSPYFKKSVVSLCKNIGSSEMLGVLKQLENEEDIYLLKEICVAEILIEGFANPVLLDKVASDPMLRFPLYAELNVINKAELIPAEYRNVVKLAESILMQALLENEELELNGVNRIQYLGERKVKENGQKGIQYLFKYTVDKEDYIGVTGIYGKEVSVDEYEYNSYSLSTPYFGESASTIFKQIDADEKKKRKLIKQLKSSFK